MKRTITAVMIQAGTAEDGETTITYMVKPEDLKDFQLTLYRPALLTIEPYAATTRDQPQAPPSPAPTLP
jgi:hypothetical protein